MQKYNRNIIAPLCLSICCVVMLVGCSKKNAQIRYLNIPSNLLQLNFEYDTTFYGIDSRFKIVAYYDSTICNNCVLKNIGNWYKVANLVENNCNLMSLLIIFSPKKDDLNELLYSLNDNPLDYPLFVDTVGAFSVMNPVLSGIGSYVALLDSLNNVIIEGNPLFDREIFYEYERIINNYQNYETFKY